MSSSAMIQTPAVMVVVSSSSMKSSSFRYREDGRESADDAEFSKKNSKEEEEKEIESLKPIKVPMMNLDVSTTLADLELLLGPDEKKLEEERKEKEEEAKYLKLKETREMKQKSMDESSSDDDMSLDERTRRIREENRKKFRVDLSKESSGGDGLVDLLKPPSSDDDEVKSEEKGKEEGGSKSIDSSNNNVVSSRDEKLEKVLADLGKIAQRKKMKEEGKMASSDEDDEAELQREERELQKQFDALLDILEEPGIPPVSKEDVDVIKNEIFGMQTFFVTSVETIGGDLDDMEAGPGDNAAAATSSGGRRRNSSMGQGGTGALFRGNLRKDRQEVWDEVRAKLYDMFDNKYEIFMLEEPDALSPNSPGPGESVSNTRGPRVSFLVVPADRAGPSEETGFWQYLIALALIGFTVGSAVQLGLVAEVSRLPEETMRWLAEGGGAAGIDPSIDPSAPPPGLENFDTVAYVEAALPVTAGVLLSSLAHEVGHRVVGAMRNVKLSIPYLIPNGQLGTFGTITQIKSIPENRSDFFDVAIAGPLCGGVTALALFSYGLVLSIGHDPASLLLGGVSELLLTMGDGDATATGAAAATSAIVVHPYFIAGWCGLTTTALNLLPVGQLDGGRVSQAAFGRRVLSATSLGTYVGLTFGILGSTLSLPWLIFILICQRTPDYAPKDDVTEVDESRATLAFACIAVAFLILLPGASLTPSDLAPTDFF
ncbi:unnamed protein product [Bathycoccus prasinos]